MSRPQQQNSTELKEISNRHGIWMVFVDAILPKSLMIAYKFCWRTALPGQLRTFLGLTIQRNTAITKTLNFYETSNNTITVYVIISAVKRLIVINHIQNKSFCLHNIWVYTVYIYLFIYKYKHMHVYI